jgi:hypothetical protein
MRLSLLLRALRKEDGISLVMAIGILAVLSVSGTTVVYSANANARSAEYSSDNGGAYDLAEAGLNEIMAVLANPQNNALVPTLLPPTTRTYAAGSVTWSGTLNYATSTWSITSIGTIKNPTGATKDVTRTLRAEVPITPTYTQPLNNPAWDFIYATRTGNTCDMSLSNNVLGAARLYVEGNFCLLNNSAVQISSLVVRGNVDIANNGQIGTNTSMSTRVEAYVGGNCRYGGGAWATCTGNQDSRHIYGKMSGPNWVVGVNHTPVTVAKPTADFNEWYTRAVPGPTVDCTNVNGARTGSPPTFDNDAVLNNSVPTVADLTPAASYTCRVGSPSSPAGRLDWNATTKVLTIYGTVLIDGSAKIANGALNQYNGQGTIYVSGSFYVDGKMCGGVSGSNCDFAAWNPNTEMLMIVTNGSGGLAGVGNGALINQNGQYQGGIFANSAISFMNNAYADGPLVGSTINFANNVTANTFPTITSVPVGMPSNPEVYAQPNPPRLYSG